MVQVEELNFWVPKMQPTEPPGDTHEGARRADRRDERVRVERLGLDRRIAPLAGGLSEGPMRSVSVVVVDELSVGEMEKPEDMPELRRPGHPDPDRPWNCRPSRWRESEMPHVSLRMGR